MAERDLEAKSGQEEQIGALIEGLVVFNTLHWRDSDCSGMMDHDGEYEIVLDEASVRVAEEARSQLLKLVSDDASLMPPAIRAMARKLAAIPREDKYEVGHTEGGDPSVSPERATESDRWPSYALTKAQMLKVVKGLGKQAARFVGGTEFDSMKSSLNKFFDL